MRVVQIARPYRVKEETYTLPDGRLFHSDMKISEDFPIPVGGRIAFRDWDAINGWVIVTFDIYTEDEDPSLQSDPYA